MQCVSQEHGLLSRGGLAHNGEILLGAQAGTQAKAKEGVIIDYQNLYLVQASPLLV